MVSSQTFPFRASMLERSIGDAVEFLVNCQQKDGGFPVARWHSNGALVEEDSLFSTACILLAIGELLPSQCRHAALSLLQRRCDPQGFWHFDALGDLPADAD